MSTDKSRSAGMYKSEAMLGTDCEIPSLDCTLKVYAMTMPLVAYRGLTLDKDTG